MTIEERKRLQELREKGTLTQQDASDMIELVKLEEAESKEEAKRVEESVELVEVEEAVGAGVEKPKKRRK